MEAEINSHHRCATCVFWWALCWETSHYIWCMTKMDKFL